MRMKDIKPTTRPCRCSVNITVCCSNQAVGSDHMFPT